MSKEIGDILIELRNETGYTQEQLCSGLCSVSTLARIESNELLPEYFLLDRIFGRLGKSTERLEYVLPGNVYELYELRYKIQAAIAYQKFGEAEELLAEYEKKKQAGKELHQQFIWKQRAQIAWICGKEAETVLENLNTAIRQTMLITQDVVDEKLHSGIKNMEWKTALSAEELKLLLFHWEVCQGTNFERRPEELMEILNYIEKGPYGTEEKASVYPYAVLLAAEYFKEQIDKKRLLKMLEDSLELLREEGRILYMPEILEIYASALEEDEQQVKELLDMKDALLDLENEFGIHMEKYRLFQYMNRLFELDYEVIRKNRLARKVSQEELCCDICSSVTLSRIEQGKSRPNNKNLDALLRKLNRVRKRIGMFVTTERYEMIALEKKLARAIERKEWEQIEELRLGMEQRLDMSFVENQQYVKAEKIRSEVNGGNLTFQEGIEKLYEVLSITFSEKTEDVFSYRLTHREANILNQIALWMSLSNQREQAVEIWRKFVKSYEESDVHVVFRQRDWALMNTNLSGLLVFEIERYEEEVLQIYQKCIRAALETGKGNGIGDFVSLKGWLLEWKQDKACGAKFRQVVHLYKLMKRDYQSQCVEDYIKQKKLEE